MIRWLLISLLLISPAVAAEYRTAPPPPDDSEIVAAAKECPGVRVHEGLRDPFLVELAQDYAERMAAIDSQSFRGQGHFGWEQRRAKILTDLLMADADEVTAETWKDRPDDQVGQQMFESWEASSGHWSVVSKPHRRYGDGLARSKNRWFGCIIVAD